MKNVGENVVRIEAEALRALADRIAGPMAAAFHRAVDLLFCCAGRVVVTGMGKSGLIARKIAATLSSTGTPALYLHPVDALHGDLGMVVRGDVVLALSASGETDVIYEMSRKKLGVTAVVEGERLVGVISDGDLRRLLEKRGKDVLDLTAGECMTKNPRTIAAGEFAATALALMEEKKITSLMVVDGGGKLKGIVHLHDLWSTELV